MGFSSLAEFGSYVFEAAEGVGISASTVSTAADVAGSAALAVGTGVATNALMAGKRPAMPPNPVMGQQQQDEAEEQAQQNALRRQSIAGGINSTVGTSGGQAGQVLDPANMSGKSLLGQ